MRALRIRFQAGSLFISWEFGIGTKPKLRQSRAKFEPNFLEERIIIRIIRIRIEKDEGLGLV
jgi:hypothetical protein